MKEMQMFPQITEEPEDNLINLEDELESQNKESPSPPSSKSSSSLFESVEEAAPSKDEAPVPKIIAVDVDDSKPKPESNHVAVVENDLAAAIPRVRMRSLSGGTYRLGPAPEGRMRRQSGDDVLTAMSPTRRTAVAIFDAFRPRSKSDSKGKKPTFLATIRNSIFNNSSNHQRKASLDQDYLDPLGNGDCRVGGSREYRQRSRSGSETRGGTMSKMMDMFRNRSNSISIDQRKKDRDGKKPVGYNQPLSAFSRRYSVDPDRRRHHTTAAVQRSLELPLDHGIQPRYEIVHDPSNEENPLAIPKFFENRTCYDAMPTSVKVVILDVQLEVEKAFHSLVGNTIRAAPLWDVQLMDFVGMLTISDFIDVLIHYYNSSEDNMQDLPDQPIRTWRSITNKPNNFIHIHPDASLTDAIKTLVHQQVHRLPVYDPASQSVLFIITHKRILKYLCVEGLDKSIFPHPACMRKTLGELRIGTYENIATATLDTTIIDALKIFHERKVSALPVLEDNELINIYAKFDVLALANEQNYRNLDMTIREALERRAESFEKVVTCKLEDCLLHVIKRMKAYEVHRIVIVSNNNTVIGMLSLSDILKFLVLKPLGMLDDVPVSTLDEAVPVASSSSLATDAPVASSSCSAPEIQLLNEPESAPEEPERPETSDSASEEKVSAEIHRTDSFD